MFIFVYELFFRGTLCRTSHEYERTSVFRGPRNIHAAGCFELRFEKEEEKGKDDDSRGR